MEYLILGLVSALGGFTLGRYLHGFGAPLAWALGPMAAAVVIGSCLYFTLNPDLRVTYLLVAFAGILLSVPILWSRFKHGDRMT